MKQGQMWSTDYNCPVSVSFFNGVSEYTRGIKLDITNCKIIITEFGMFELWLKKKRIKPLTFEEYMKYRKSVKEIINRDRGNDYD